jgi:hypothetical protein
LPPPRPAPLAYRRAGVGWRVVALALAGFFALQMMLIPRRTLGGSHSFGEFLQVVAFRYALVVLACFALVGGVGRLLLGRRPSARGPLLAMALVYAVLVGQRALHPEPPPGAPVPGSEVAGSTPPAPAPSIASTSPDPAPATAPPPAIEPEWHAPVAVETQTAAPTSPAPTASTPPPVGTAPQVIEVIDDWAITADRLQRAYDWPALLAHGQRWAAAQPREPRAWQAMGIGLARLGRFDEAIAAYERQVALAPDNHWGLRNLANAYHDKGDLRGAVDVYERLVARHPRDVQGWLWLGGDLSLLGDYDEAVAALEQATKLRPDSRDTWIALGAAHARAGYPDRAAEAYARANRKR